MKEAAECGTGQRRNLIAFSIGMWAEFFKCIGASGKLQFYLNNINRLHFEREWNTLSIDIIN